MTKESPAAALARMKWAKMTEAAKLAHIAMMTKARKKQARKSRLDKLAQVTNL